MIEKLALVLNLIVEPNALIGSAGPRVIENKVHMKLPEGFERAEFLVTKGAVELNFNRRDAL